MVENLEHLHKNADKSYILVVDDANFEGVIKYTEDFLDDKKVLYGRVIRTETPEDENDWWNGIYVVVIEK